MTFKTLVKRFQKVGGMLEYKSSNGKGYYVDGNFVTSSRESIEKTLYQLEGDKLEQVWGSIKSQLIEEPEKDVLKILEDNKHTFEYGQKELFDYVLDNVDNYYYNGTSLNKAGYYWYTLTIDNINYEVYCK